jgi:hypothetical protein
MKKFVFIYTICALIVLQLQAQNCAMYHPLTKGFSAEFQSYRKNKKPNGKAIHTVKDVQPAGNGVKATIEIVNTDPNGKPGPTVTYTVECQGGVTRIDTRAAISGPPDPAYTDEGSCFTELPADMNVGHVFNDCLFSSKAKAYFEVKIYNRKVTGKETITVGAGTFDAFVIEYDMHSVMRQGMEVEFDKHHKDWYAPGKGLIKTESYQPGHKRNRYQPGDIAFFSSEMISSK